MAIIRDQHTQDGARILIWKDEESLDFFLKRVKLSSDDLILLNKYSVERRKKDLLIARFLIQKEIPEAEITYLKNGKPYLKNQTAQISISHSKDLVAIITHPTQKVAIDIEYISPRVEKLKHRFLSDNELLTANTTELLTLYWSAKETLFKRDEKQGIDFNKDLEIKLKDKTLHGIIRNNDFTLIHYCIKDSWVITYTIS